MLDQNRLFYCYNINEHLGCLREMAQIQNFKYRQSMLDEIFFKKILKGKRGRKARAKNIYGVIIS
jgi:hypothetical protein